MWRESWGFVFLWEDIFGEKGKRVERFFFGSFIWGNILGFGTHEQKSLFSLRPSSLLSCQLCAQLFMVVFLIHNKSPSSKYFFFLDAIQTLSMTFFSTYWGLFSWRGESGMNCRAVKSCCLGCGKMRSCPLDSFIDKSNSAATNRTGLSPGGCKSTSLLPPPLPFCLLPYFSCPKLSERLLFIQSVLHGAVSHISCLSRRR